MVSRTFSVLLGASSGGPPRRLAPPSRLQALRPSPSSRPAAVETVSASSGRSGRSTRRRSASTCSSRRWTVVSTGRFSTRRGRAHAALGYLALAGLEFSSTTGRRSPASVWPSSCVWPSSSNSGSNRCITSTIWSISGLGDADGDDLEALLRGPGVGLGVILAVAALADGRDDRALVSLKDVEVIAANVGLGQRLADLAHDIGPYTRSRWPGIMFSWCCR